jgi:hypothetical protein
MATYDDDRAPARDSLTMRMDGLRGTIIGVVLALGLLAIGAIWMFSTGDHSAGQDNSRLTTQRSSAPTTTPGKPSPATPKQP